jgi:hypothetical protein
VPNTDVVVRDGRTVGGLSARPLNEPRRPVLDRAAVLLRHRDR